MLKENLNAKMATLNTDNGYKFSVIFGSIFYSDGKETYEMAIVDLATNELTDKFFDGEDSVKGYLFPEEITEIMKRVQNEPRS